MKQVHGHEVMRMMLESDTGFTRDSLRAAIRERFGEYVRFYTCSASDMDADGLIDFLEERQKFVDRPDGFQTDPGRICNH